MEVPLKPEKAEHYVFCKAEAAKGKIGFHRNRPISLGSLPNQLQTFAEIAGSKWSLCTYRFRYGATSSYHKYPAFTLDTPDGQSQQLRTSATARSSIQQIMVRPRCYISFVNLTPRSTKKICRTYGNRKLPSPGCCAIAYEVFVLPHQEWRNSARSQLHVWETSFGHTRSLIPEEELWII
jgi:hypothetical protein